MRGRRSLVLSHRAPPRGAAPVETANQGGTPRLPAGAPDVDALLDHFLLGTAIVTQGRRVEDGGALPVWLVGRIAAARRRRRTYRVWRTPDGYTFASGLCDEARSRQFGAWVIWVEWSTGAETPAAAWWHCYPTRPREWIAGDGSAD